MLGGLSFQDTHNISGCEINPWMYNVTHTHIMVQGGGGGGGGGTPQLGFSSFKGYEKKINHR